MGNCCGSRAKSAKDGRVLKQKQIVGTSNTAAKHNKSLLVKTIRDVDNDGSRMTVKSATFRKPINEIVKILSQTSAKMVVKSNTKSTLKSSLMSHQSNKSGIKSNSSALDNYSNTSAFGSNTSALGSSFSDYSDLGSNIPASGIHSVPESTLINSQIDSSVISGLSGISSTPSSDHPETDSNISGFESENLPKSKKKDSTTKPKNIPPTINTISKSKQKVTPPTQTPVAKPKPKKLK